MKVNLFANFNGPIGYASHAREFGYAISKYVDMNLIPTEAYQPHEHPTAKTIKLTGLFNVENVDFSAIGIGIMYGSHYSLAQFCGSKRICYTTWEMERPHESWVGAMNQMDAVWVPSTWVKTVFEKAGVDHVDVVHEGVDTKVFNPFAVSLMEKRSSLIDDKPQESQRLFDTEGKFTFLAGGKWEPRKGQDATLRAYTQAFEPDEPVQLILHCTNPFEADLNIFQELFSLRLGAHAEIVVGQGMFPTSEYASFFTTGDAYVFPTRAEGFGLPILEGLASGTPVITTGVTGHADFVNKDVAYIVKTKKVPVQDPKWFAGFEDTTWNDPDVDHLAELMRYVYEHPEEAKKKGKAAYKHAKDWTWDRGAKQALALLEEMA